MKSILKWSLVLTMAITTTHCSRDEEPTVVNGTDGKDGVDGKNGSVIHSGEGTPATSLGSVGDFYFDKKAQALYGPKTSNGWGEPTSLKGKDGTNGTNGSQILSGTTAPTSTIGNIGDWYIDLQTLMLYGPKTESGWGTGVSLKNKNNLRGKYILSEDGKTLYSWLDKETTEQLDMQSDAELSNVTTIGRLAFERSNLKEITLPKGLTKIGIAAFSQSSLSSIIIPNGVTNIEKSAFQDNQLEYVRIPNSVTSIGDFTFQSNRLTSVSIPNSVTSIGICAFQYNNITSVSISNTVTSIGIQAFYWNQLTSITIPSSVTSIGNQAFAYNPLSIVIVEATTPPTLGSYVFYNNNNSDLKIYVPAGSVDAYKNANGWREYADKIYAK